jgi:hypothetical protein
MIRDATAVRYMVLIRVSALDVPHVAQQTSPDGSEVETLEVTLRAGETDAELVADSTHRLAVNGVVKLWFSGRTLLPRWESK